MKQTKTHISSSDAQQLANSSSALRNGQHVKLAADGRIWQAIYNHDKSKVLTASMYGEIAIWQISDGQCLGKFLGHSRDVYSIAISAAEQYVLSGSKDETLRLWDTGSQQCLQVFSGHSGPVRGVGISADGRFSLSASRDETLRLWDNATGQCVQVFHGHIYAVYFASFFANDTQIISCSADNTLRLWQVENGQCLRVLEGHTDFVFSVACSSDEQFAISGSDDETLRLWDLTTGKCLRVFEGHTDRVRSVAFSDDGCYILSGSDDCTVRLWDCSRGQCLTVFEPKGGTIRGVAFSADCDNAYSVDAANNLWRWNISQFTDPNAVEILPTLINYTNAKVLVLGDPNSGKTGLTERLVLGRFTPSDSTSGAWSTRWKIADPVAPADTEREIWMWDFGGQADQRLIHQLYMERCDLVLLLFDADRDDVFPSIRDWQSVLGRCAPPGTPKLLVASRTDVGSKFNRSKMTQFALDSDFVGFFETSAKEGYGCEELRAAILANIPWDKLERRSSPRIFKLTKDAILAIRNEGTVLCTLRELHVLLEQRLPPDEALNDAILTTVIRLLDGPGIVQELGYGDFILLQPEWINAYAQAVIRTLRADPKELGCLPLGSIAQGQLLFQTISGDSTDTVEMRRLPQFEERIVLREMERQLELRFLCLRQDGHLVFPSHCGSDRPALSQHPEVFVSYALQGFLDDIYATLVVKLAQSKAFMLSKPWRDAADFTTLKDSLRMGVQLSRDNAGQGQIDVYFDNAILPNEQIIFANYIHDHLKATSKIVTRLRHYVCRTCHTRKPASAVLTEKLRKLGKLAKVVCDNCDGTIKLWDDLEQRFGDQVLEAKVHAMRQIDQTRFDSRRKGKLLALEVAARINSANQKSIEIGATEDDGIDMQLEFTDDPGGANGKRLYLQLKCGSSHLVLRKDGSEIFKIKKQRWVRYWLDHDSPVMLVIGTLDGELDGSQKTQFKQVRWMEIRDLLERESAGGKPVRHIVFQGEDLDRESILRWREKIRAS